MSEQDEAVAKLSKSQKKKKAAQKKKVRSVLAPSSVPRELMAVIVIQLAKKNVVEEVIQDAEWWLQRRRDEIDARIVSVQTPAIQKSQPTSSEHQMDEFNDNAMNTRDFQMLNIRGKLLVHPSKRFLDALSNQRLAMGRETYPLKIRNMRRHQSLGFYKSMIPSWSMSTSFIPLNSLLDSKSDALTDGDSDSKPPFIRLFEPPRPRPKGAYVDQSLEQFVFDPMNPTNVKQLEWVARRLDTPPSPPQTPTSDTPPTIGDSLHVNDPFRFPAVLNKRWSDYDDDDESLGSPMSLPITPESSFDVPHLDLNGSQGTHPKAAPRRASTYIVAVPTLTNTAPWFSTKKTVLPIPRISLHMPEEYPRSTESSSVHPMKLDTSLSKPFPDYFTTNSRRTRGRIERWVRADAEQNFRARLTLSSAARKQIDSEAELAIYNKISAFTALDSDKIYMGEPDILGAGVGVCVDDVREVILGRFKDLEKTKENGGRKGRLTQGTISKTWDKIVLIPSAEGWICKQLARDGI
ncbi:hypothetical protein BU17DRAFT_98732 [Hysterangium stoloniferum]|nr:hypothetical protein BU17DRAFT_98732 [Hysterangium stoloniferum]